MHTKLTLHHVLTVPQKAESHKRSEVKGSNSGERHIVLCFRVHERKPLSTNEKSL